MSDVPSDLVFASCSAYAIGWAVGAEQATRLVTQSVADETIAPAVPAVEALRLLRKLVPIALRVDGGATHIGKSRSRHFAAALAMKAPVWLTVDDDVTADSECIGTLLDAVAGEVPRVCLAPCRLRGNPDVAAVEWSTLHITRNVNNAQGVVRRAIRGGFGLVAVNRPALLAIADASPQWRDDADGKLKPAPFLEILEPAPGSRWLGEDLAFFARLPQTVEVEASVTGNVRHGTTPTLALRGFR